MSARYHKLCLLIIYTYIFPFCYIPSYSKDVNNNYIHGLHLTMWAAGHKKTRSYLNKLINEGVINTVVIAVKEVEGKVCVPGVREVEEVGAYVPAIPDIKDYITYLNAIGVKTVARIVVFKDDFLSRHKPYLGVKKAHSEELWRDRKGHTWVDPYRREVWDYILAISKKAVEIGFKEVQYDYVRFPSDGNIKLCRYSYEKHTSTSAINTIIEFLKYVSKELKPLNVTISVCVFGLTPSVSGDLGIGQHFPSISQYVDYVSPMMYPSHYYRGVYNLENPNREPYKTVYRTTLDALNILKKERLKLCPYLQHFSLYGVKYGPKQIAEQLRALYDNKVYNWIFWDPECKYEHLPEAINILNNEAKNTSVPATEKESGGN